MLITPVFLQGPRIKESQMLFLTLQQKLNPFRDGLSTNILIIMWPHASHFSYQDQISTLPFKKNLPHVPEIPQLPWKWCSGGVEMHIPTMLMAVELKSPDEDTHWFHGHVKEQRWRSTDAEDSSNVKHFPIFFITKYKKTLYLNFETNNKGL